MPMPFLLILLIVVGAVLLFEFAAQRWGYDSRDDFRFGRDGFRFTRR
jgi:hypothetical protein